MSRHMGPLNADTPKALQMTPDYDDDEMEFLKAIEAYKKKYRRPYPTWSEALKVLRSLGYVKVGSDNKGEGTVTGDGEGV